MSPDLFSPFSHSPPLLWLSPSLSCPLSSSPHTHEGKRRDAQDAMKYIQKMYEQQAHSRDKKEDSKTLYPHFTCATDTNNIRKVFSDVKDTVLLKSLMEFGVIWGPGDPPTYGATLNQQPLRAEEALPQSLPCSVFSSLNLSSNGDALGPNLLIAGRNLYLESRTEWRDSYDSCITHLFYTHIHTHTHTHSGCHFIMLCVRAWRCSGSTSGWNWTRDVMKCCVSIMWVMTLAGGDENSISLPQPCW